jgi:hypothetical protein
MSIAERLKQRKQTWWKRHHRKPGISAAAAGAPAIERPRSRRRLLDTPRSEVNNYDDGNRNITCVAADVELIKEKLGVYKHHGTGNPLLVRSPTTPKDLAIRNLAGVIQTGVIGLPTSNSTPTLKTEVGKNSESFWTNRVRLAGSYGWTGLILPEDADASKPFPVAQALWIVVQDDSEYDHLKALLLDASSGSNGNAKWESTRRKVVTISQLADQLRKGRDGDALAGR